MNTDKWVAEVSLTHSPLTLPLCAVNSTRAPGFIPKHLCLSPLRSPTPLTRMVSCPNGMAKCWCPAPHLAFISHRIALGFCGQQFPESRGCGGHGHDRNHGYGHGQGHITFTIMCGKETQ